MKKYIWTLLIKIRTTVIYRILKIQTQGVRVALLKNEKVLLIKHHYDDFWVFPGGGIKRGESVEKAAIREVEEEVNYKIQGHGHLKKRGIYQNNSKHKQDKVHFFTCSSDGFIKINTRKKLSGKIEVEKQEWFSTKNLPKISEPTKRRIGEIQNFNDNDTSKINFW